MYFYLCISQTNSSNLKLISPSLKALRYYYSDRFYKQTDGGKLYMSETIHLISTFF